MNEKKEIPPIELSAKYMAWDVKRLADSMSRMTDLLEKFLPLMTSESPKTQQRLPF